MYIYKQDKLEGLFPHSTLKSYHFLVVSFPISHISSVLELCVTIILLEYPLHATEGRVSHSSTTITTYATSSHPQISPPRLPASSYTLRPTFGFAGIRTIAAGGLAQPNRTIFDHLRSRVPLSPLPRPLLKEHGTPNPYPYPSRHHYHYQRGMDPIP